MDYLTQARTFLHRANDTNDVEERMTRLSMAAEMLAKAIDQLGQSGSISLSGLSRQEEEVLALLQDRGSQARPACPGPVPFAGVGHARF